MSRCILLVDDEELILKAFRRIFNETDYTVFLANSGKEALKILSQETIDILVSDMRMPEMDGMELLHRVKLLYPQIIRVILSGYADDQMIFQSLSQNLAKLYLYKPWQNEALIQQMERLFIMKDRLTSLHLKESLLSYGDLPTQNLTYLKLVAMLKRDAGITEITPIIEADLAISTRVLRIANSAYYGIRSSSVKQALVFFGINHIREIVLTCTLFNKASEDSKYTNYLDILWKHSNLTSHILTGIYERILKEKIPDESQMVGLLHDIGRVLLLDQYPVAFEYLSASLEDHNTDQIAAMETKIFGVTHGELGGLMLDWWDFPYSIVEGAIHHHNPIGANLIHEKLVIVLHVADKLSWYKSELNIEDFVDHESLNLLNINSEQLMELMIHIESLQK